MCILTSFRSETVKGCARYVGPLHNFRDRRVRRHSKTMLSALTKLKSCRVRHSAVAVES
jgi:hypothetical protein